MEASSPINGRHRQIASKAVSVVFMPDTLRPRHGRSRQRWGGYNGGVIVATTWIDGMTDVLQVMLLLATLIWTVVKIAQAIKDLKGD